MQNSTNISLWWNYGLFLEIIPCNQIYIFGFVLNYFKVRYASWKKLDDRTNNLLTKMPRIYLGEPLKVIIKDEKFAYMMIDEKINKLIKLQNCINSD